MERSDELRASLEELAADHQRRTERLSQMREDIANLSVSARTRDGLVSVEVGSHGELRGIQFDPRVFDRMTPQRLSHTIMELVGQATADASGQAREVFASFMPDRLAEKLRNGEDDLFGLLPKGPSMLHRRADG